MAGELVIIAKDVVATLTPTAIPTTVPPFDEADIELVTIISGVTATATQDQTVDAYNATDWADGTKPSVAHHIMFGVAGGVRQWKAKDALAAGDMLVATVKPKGQTVKTS